MHKSAQHTAGHGEGKKPAEGSRKIYFSRERNHSNPGRIWKISRENNVIEGEYMCYSKLTILRMNIIVTVRVSYSLEQMSKLI